MSDDQQHTTAMAIDRSSPVPMYHQLKQILLRSIENGEITAGGALPSEREIQERYGVSRITVRQAMNDLVSGGYIRRESGRGTFVLPRRVQDRSGKLGGLFEDLADQGFDVCTRILKHDRRRAPPDVAQKLGLNQGQRVLFVKRLIRGDDKPISVASGYFKVDRDVTFTVEELVSDSLFVLLERKYGIHWPTADKTLEAVGASEEEAKLLEIRPGTPVLLSKVIVYDAMGKPTAWFRAVYRSDSYKYRCTLNR